MQDWCKRLNVLLVVEKVSTHINHADYPTRNELGPGETGKWEEMYSVIQDQYT